MKKSVLALLLALTMLLIAVPAFATTTDNQADNSWLEQRLDWLEQKTNWQKSQLDQMVEDGAITAEQSRAWKEHLDYVYKFHQENGFLCPGANQGWQGKRMGMRGGAGGAGMGFGWRQAMPRN